MAAAPVGDHLREWRRRRRMSQLDLACEAEISSRHLSFVETGRAAPSREMVLRLAERLEVPMRERNVLLVAAGYAPIFPERSLASPELAAAREAIRIILDGHRPYPAFALDRRWNMVMSNGALPQLFDGVDPALLAAPVNVVRLSLHPRGVAPNILNLAEWRAHMLARLRHQVELTADPVLIDLLAEALRRRRGAAGARIVGRHGDGAQDAGGWRDAVVLHHHPRLRHAGGGDALGAGDRVVPARRRRDRRGGAQVRGLPAL